MSEDLGNLAEFELQPGEEELFNMVLTFNPKQGSDLASPDSIQKAVHASMPKPLEFRVKVVEGYVQIRVRESDLVGVDEQERQEFLRKGIPLLVVICAILTAVVFGLAYLAVMFLNLIIPTLGAKPMTAAWILGGITAILSLISIATAIIKEGKKK